MSTFGWCMTGKHSECRRRVQRFIHTPATRKQKAGVEMLDEYYECQCTKRSCKCYVPAKDRDKRKRKK